MNKLYVVFAIATMMVLTFSSQVAMAQTVEGDPTYDYVFTPYYPENESMPVDIRTATQPALSATPNPVADQTLKVWYNALMGTSQIEVFNIKGQMMRTATVGSSHERSGVQPFSINDLTPGVYIIRLTSGAYQAAQKVILR